MSETQSSDRNALNICAPVFFTSAALIIAFSFYGAVFSDQAEQVFAHVQSYITDTYAWLYVSSVAVFLIFILGLAISDYGRIKLGPDDSEPDYSYTSWFAMHFTAGMGIGLMFFGVAEPIMHFQNPPVGDGGTIDAAREAMKLTFFHWGVHAWGIYIVTGLALAYFAFRHDLPLSIRSSLYPLIGERIYGPIGHAVDTFAVLGTMFGVATSLGLGVMQVNAGLNYLFDIDISLTTQIILIAVITFLATGSVVAGLDKGILRLSVLNLILAAFLLLFVLAAGPTVFLLNTLFQNLGSYVSDLVNMTFKLYAYEPNEWISNWTLFYWGWWISWSPFVGMFIARVSRGRTIREFIIGVLFVPAGFTFLWLAVFGNTALHLTLYEGITQIVTMVEGDMPVALFAMLDQLPWSAFTSLVATVLVITFFVTSYDSGSLVICMLTSGGMEEPPTWQRIFWAVSEGVVAAVLLIAGGLSALQTAAITSALPFTFIMLFICIGLMRGLQISKQGFATPEHLPALTDLGAGRARTWRHRIHNLFTYHARDEVIEYLRQVVRPALEQAAVEFEHRDLKTAVTESEEEVTFTVYHNGHKDFSYTVRMRSYIPTFVLPDYGRHRGSRRYYEAEVDVNKRKQEVNIMGYSQDQIIHDMLGHYEIHMQMLEPGTASR